MVLGQLFENSLVDRHGIATPNAQYVRLHCKRLYAIRVCFISDFYQSGICTSHLAAAKLSQISSRSSVLPRGTKRLDHKISTRKKYIKLVQFSALLYT